MNLIDHIRKSVTISGSDIKLIENTITKVNVKKKELLLMQQDFCKNLLYVEKGCLRIYGVDKNGFENNIFFAIEDWIALDLESFVKKTPARFYIQSIEASSLAIITRDNFYNLLEVIPTLEKWYRNLLENALIASEERIHIKSAYTASERYDQFLLKYPKLESRISQRQIASYLSISPEFLSSLKAKKLKNLNLH